jgi:glutaredoxin
MVYRKKNISRRICSTRKIKFRSIRKSRKRRKSPNKALIVYKSVLKSKRLTTPLTIYTAPGCPACTEVKELCKKKGIKFRVLNRRNHSKYVKKNTGNCRYVPNVFNFNKEYIGGNEDLTKLIKGIKNTVN